MVVTTGYMALRELCHSLDRCKHGKVLFEYLYNNNTFSIGYPFSIKSRCLCSCLVQIQTIKNIADGICWRDADTISDAPYTCLQVITKYEHIRFLPGRNIVPYRFPAGFLHILFKELYENNTFKHF